MEEAIQLAIEAGSAGEVPVGAVVVSEGVVLGRGRNRMVERSDPRAHAEMVAIDDARERSGKARLDGATLYVTLEPCPQCAGAILCAICNICHPADDIEDIRDAIQSFASHLMSVENEFVEL
jgi:tRNA(adenine34) deaminase